METRALTPRPARRALVAAGLLTLLVAVLLGAWFWSGWVFVRARQAQTRAAPVHAAEAKAAEIGRELRGELERLIGTEVERPYFQYQNLFHDPRTSAAGLSVSPSPLATAPADRFVLGYFQLDARGRASTPTINDDVPELSEPTRLAEHRAFRDAVARDLARALAPKPVVAQLDSPPPQQVIQIDPSTYAQNAAPNMVYRQPTQAALDAAGAVTITVSALDWRTLAFQGAPALVAVRGVQTPDGTLTQGFVVDRSAVTSWLAGRAGDMVAELHADSASGVEIAPGWSLTVVPNPRALAQAAVDAAAVARDFLIRFVGVGLLASLAAALVVLVVVRAERLARERSQFAAAAAHELRTPLAGLQLYGDMLADGLGDPAKQRDYARRLSEEASRLGRVVSNVLGFSQLERGNLSVDAQVGPLGEALCDLADRAQPALDRAGAVLDLDVSRDLRARFDRDALARIVANLLDNAEKYSRTSDDRTIHLAAADLGHAIEVVIADHGPGIADASGLFRPFRRGVSSDAPAGLGLGLALSRSLAVAMGGDLAYRPSAAGASFVLTLPRA